MSNSSPDLSRRDFFKVSAAAIATVGVANFLKPSYATEVNVKTVALSNLPKAPVEVAKSSELVQKAWDYLLSEINSLHDLALREKVFSFYQNTVPTFMEQHQGSANISKVYKMLLQEHLVDPALTDEAHLFPPLKDLNINPQPFFSAPGSGYGSHHAYPGGLATHTAVNVEITKSILTIYSHIMDYEYGYDMAVAGQLLHDLAKPWVFQWNKDGSCMKEYSIAGTGAHHIFSIAEAIYRGMPADEVVAQACAHNHPGTPKDEELVVGWIKAASILACVDPIERGLLDKDGKRLPTPHKQSGYLVHLGDHDFVLSVPAAQQSVIALKEVAAKDYGMNDKELEGEKFNIFRNYIASQYSFMHIHQAMSEADPYLAVKAIAKKVVS